MLSWHHFFESPLVLGNLIIKVDEENDRLNFEISHREAEINARKTQLQNVRENHSNLNHAADDLEKEAAQLRDVKADLEHQLFYTCQDRDRYFNEYAKVSRQLKALQAFVLEKFKAEAAEGAINNFFKIFTCCHRLTPNKKSYRQSDT